MHPHPTSLTGNLLVDYYERLPEAIAKVVDDPAPQLAPEAFSPGFALPKLTEDMERFLAAATAEWRDVGRYGGHRLVLLDLARNPGTHTTKTFPSLLIVARAVEHIRQTGEPVMIFSPTSANKGVGLRDAVLRAIDADLVTPEELRMVTLAPASCRDKLRASRLSTDTTLRALNPLLLYTGPGAPETVKALGKGFVEHHAPTIKLRQGTNVWFSLELRNYLVADTARAFFEHTVDPTDGATRPRIHAHAVSSAFGLLGYHQGRAVLEADGRATDATRPASLLVQHLATPDMVLSLTRGSFDRAHIPRYRLDPGSGLHTQRGDPHFPEATHDPDEVLDPTFYTHQPVTSPTMNDLIARYGGSGIVVSLHECIERYPMIRTWLADVARPLPADLRTVREWSLVMAFTGVLNAIDRGLVEPDRDIVVHGSGWYTSADYEPIDPSAVVEVATDADVAAALLG